MRFRKIIILSLQLLLFIPALLSGGCEKEEILPVRRADITLVTSFQGSGDLGYNDLIFDGVCNAASATGATLSVIRPTSTDDVRRELKQWITEGDTSSTGLIRVLVFSSMDYAVALQGLDTPDSNHLILVVDGDEEQLPAWCRAVSFDRYGASYLAGCMAGECPCPVIMAARAGDPVLQRAIDGFSDGYTGVNAYNSSSAPQLKYLADDYSGFASADKAYRFCSSLPEGAFVFPLAGGSDSGVYKYIREHDFTNILAAGMDVDCSGMAPRIPFSLTVRVDKAIEKILTAVMHNDMTLLPSAPYDLESGYVTIEVNPGFYDSLLIWEDYYDSPDYWENRKTTFLRTAIEAERKNSQTQRQ